MSTVILLHGNPGSGKSFLAKELAAKYSFFALHVDDVYVSFIRDFCPDLYFAALSLYIGPHYDKILIHREHSKRHFHRDFVAEWHDHLHRQILTVAHMHSRVVVEGYLLRDFQDRFMATISPDVQVFLIEVASRTYRVNGNPTTIDQIAVLGASL